jgi:hypothetical protein
MAAGMMKGSRLVLFAALAFGCAGKAETQLNASMSGGDAAGGSTSTPSIGGNFSVSVAMDGAIGTACGRGNLLHGIVFACSAVGSIGASSFSINMGVPTG